MSDQATYRHVVATIKTNEGRLRDALYRGSTIGLAILIVLIWGIPIYWMVVTSFKPENQVLAYPPEWLPRELTLEHYARIFSMFPVLQWFQNSLIVAVATTLLVLAVQSLAAYPLARMRFRGRNLLLILILSSFLIPPEITYIPLFLAFSGVKLTDSYFSLIAPVTAGPFGLFLFLQFFKGLPTELEDAARIDGCNSFRIYWNIVVPLSQPAVIAVAIFTFMGSWNNFMWPLLVASTDETFTLPVGLANVATRTWTVAFVYGDAMAASAIATAPALLVFLLLQRHFVQGVTMSGLKG